MSDVMIEAQGLSKRYGAVTALSNVSFDVHKGEVLGFLGPNGAGKTTAMKILTCFIAPTEGTAKVNGCDVFDDPIGVRTALGYLPENNPLYTDMLTLEYLQWVANMRGLAGEDATKRIARVVDETSIGDVVAQPIATLSKGFRQRVGLAQALVHEPPILILDEPMNGLDPNQAVEIRDLIKTIGRSRTVVLSTHNLYEVALTCDRVLIVAHGRLVADDRPDELRARAGNPRYRVVVQEGSGDVVRKALESLPSVGSVDALPGAPAGEVHLELRSSGSDDIRSEIAAALAKTEGVLEFLRQAENLETVFRDLTAEADRAATRRKAEGSKRDEGKARGGGDKGNGRATKASDKVADTDRSRTGAEAKATESSTDKEVV